MATTLTHRPRLDTPNYPELVLVPDADREARYQAALALVTRIESNLRCSRRCLYWRISDRQPLTTLIDVINAILSDDLLLPDGMVLDGN